MNVLPQLLGLVPTGRASWGQCREGLWLPGSSVQGWGTDANPSPVSSLEAPRQGCVIQAVNPGTRATGKVSTYGDTHPTCGTLAPPHGWCHQPQPGHGGPALPWSLCPPWGATAHLQLCHPLSWKPQGATSSPGSCPGAGTQHRAPALAIPPAACAHLSLSSLRWSMFRGFRRSLRIFFFFSRSVCFFPPFFSD